MKQIKNISSFNIYFFYLLTALLLVSCQEQTDDARQMVSPQEMKELIALDTVQFIDVRTVKEFRNEHIQGAQNLVYDEDFKDKIQELDKSKPVAVYCRTGQRSAACAKILHNAGFKKIYELEGGITKWKHEDLPTVE